jgi:hypothetical protein
MWFDTEISVPASTAQAGPLETRIPVSRGVITRVSFRPRPGHSGLCRCQVHYHEHQLWPVSREESLHGDTYPIEWDEYEEILTPPYELVVRSWNDDDTYEHTFDLGFALLPEEIAEPLTPAGLLKAILSMLSPSTWFGGKS